MFLQTDRNRKLKEPLKNEKIITVTAEDDEKVEYPRFIPTESLMEN